MSTVDVVFFCRFSYSLPIHRPMNGEEKVFSTAWMYSQMTSFEDIGLIFVILFVYVDTHPPMSVYICTRDMKVGCFREAVERFFFQLNSFFSRCNELDLEPVDHSAFTEWFSSDYFWVDYPFRFSFLRIFVHREHFKYEGIGLVTGDLRFSRPGVSKTVIEGLNLSELSPRFFGPDLNDFVLLSADFA